MLQKTGNPLRFVQISGLFAGEMTAPEGPFRLSVRVTDQQGNQDTDTIEVAYRTS